MFNDRRASTMKAMFFNMSLFFKKIFFLCARKQDGDIDLEDKTKQHRRKHN